MKNTRNVGSRFEENLNISWQDEHRPPRKLLERLEVAGFRIIAKCVGGAVILVGGLFDLDELPA